MNTRNGVPQSFTDLVEAVGHDMAMVIVNTYGGTRVCVPKVFKALHPLTELLGIEQARRLSEQLGGMNLSIPSLRKQRLQERNVEIRREYDGGTTVRELVRKYELTDRQIYTILGSND
jgi:Mor transcription activator family